MNQDSRITNQNPMVITLTKQILKTTMKTIKMMTKTALQIRQDRQVNLAKLH